MNNMAPRINENQTKLSFISSWFSQTTLKFQIGTFKRLKKAKQKKLGKKVICFTNANLPIIF